MCNSFLIYMSWSISFLITFSQENPKHILSYLLIYNLLVLFLIFQHFYFKLYTFLYPLHFLLTYLYAHALSYEINMNNNVSLVVNFVANLEARDKDIDHDYDQDYDHGFHTHLINFIKNGLDKILFSLYNNCYNIFSGASKNSHLLWRFCVIDDINYGIIQQCTTKWQVRHRI